LWAFRQTPGRHARPLATTIAQQCTISCETTPARVRAHISVASPIHRPRPALCEPSPDERKEKKVAPTMSASATAPRLIRRHPAMPARHRRHPDTRKRHPCSPDHPGHWSFDGDRARAHTGHPRARSLRPIKGPLRAPSDSHRTPLPRSHPRPVSLFTIRARRQCCPRRPPPRPPLFPSIPGRLSSFHGYQADEEKLGVLFCPAPSSSSSPAPIPVAALFPLVTVSSSVTRG
jgi:hypothetical protein